MSFLFGLIFTGQSDERYIRVETCMFMIKLPQYSSQEVMTQQLMYAINCREDPLSGQTPPPLKTLDPFIYINCQWFYTSTTQNPGSHYHKHQLSVARHLHHSNSWILLYHEYMYWWLHTYNTQTLDPIVSCNYVTDSTHSSLKTLAGSFQNSDDHQTNLSIPSPYKSILSVPTIMIIYCVS